MLSRKLTSAFILTLLAVALPAHGELNQSLQAGINSFQQGKFDEAKQTFSTLLNDPTWRFAALYNLGNTAVRQSHLGEALAYYLKAQRINPHDRDTQDNINFVISSLGSRRMTGPPTNWEIFRNQVLNRFTFGEALLVTLIFSALFLAGLLKFVRAKKAEAETTPAPGLVVLGLILVLFVSFAAAKLIDTYSERAMIITDHVDLRSGPSESNASMTVITEGTEIFIHDTDHDWIQVSPVAGGITGWVPRTSTMSISGGGPF